MPHIRVAGDGTGRHMYTHAGDYGAEIAGWNAASGAPERRTDFRVMPRPVFSMPEVAAVGLTEQQARATGRDVETARVCYGDVSKAMIQGDDEGFCKIVADRGTGELLGAAMVGANSTDLVGELGGGSWNGRRAGADAPRAGARRSSVRAPSTAAASLVGVLAPQPIATAAVAVQLSDAARPRPPEGRTSGCQAGGPAFGPATGASNSEMPQY